MINIDRDLQCTEHGDVLLIVMVTRDGIPAVHRHVSEGEAAAMLSELVDQMRRNLLTEAA